MVDTKEAVLGGHGGAGEREVTKIVVVVAELPGLPVLRQVLRIKLWGTGQHGVAPTNENVCRIAFRNVVSVVDTCGHLLELEGGCAAGACSLGRAGDQPEQRRKGGTDGRNGEQAPDEVAPRQALGNDVAEGRIGAEIGAAVLSRLELNRARWVGAPAHALFP